MACIRKSLNSKHDDSAQDFGPTERKCAGRFVSEVRKLSANQQLGSL